MPYYRHSLTGIIGDYPADMAALYPELVPVGKDAKPLAFTPIPEASIAEIKKAK